MFDPILLTTDNRQLASGTGDFGVYGGQSEPGVSVHAAPDATSPSDIDSAGPGHTALAVEAISIASSVPISFSPADDAASVLSPVSYSVAAPMLWQGEPVVLEASPAPEPLPTATGAGSPVPVDMLVQPAAPEHASGDAAPTSSEGAATPEAPALAPGDGLVSGTVAPLNDVTSDLGTGKVSPLLDLTGDGTDTVIGGVADTLSDLAGSDPLGGAATLVSLVSVSDMFDLRPVEAPTVDATSDLGLGLIDTLVGEAAPAEPLLGIGHHDDAHGLGDTLDHGLGL